MKENYGKLKKGIPHKEVMALLSEKWKKSSEQERAEYGCKIASASASSSATSSVSASSPSEELEEFHTSVGRLSLY